MTYIRRKVEKKLLAQTKSLLLLGPRQTGKSTLIKKLKPDYSINLANQKHFLDFSSQPDLLSNIVATKKYQTFFIDEVQRLPNLLNTVQDIIDNENIRFFLTGSSARKLKKGQANLLPGRTITIQMNPFSYEEVPNFDLQQCLSTGMLPEIYLEPDIKQKKQILLSYAGTYLKEEIMSEALTRNIEGFSRFLMIAASKNCEYIDYAKMGTQAQIQQKTASRFFEILEDTLIVRRLPAYTKTEFKRLIKHPKFHFFDTGVLNAVLGNFKVSADRIGTLFETFTANQIFAMANARCLPIRFSQFRTEAGAEVDLILEYEDRVLAIEIKATQNISTADITGLKSFFEIQPKAERLVIYLGKHTQKLREIDILPFSNAIEFISIWMEFDS